MAKSKIESNERLRLATMTPLDPCGTENRAAPRS